MTDTTRPITRRDLINDVAAATAALAVLGPTGLAVAAERPARRASVTLVRDAAALPDGRVDVAVLKRMLEETVRGVTGKASAREAWLSLVSPTDVVGLVPTDHLNPTHEEVVAAVRASLVEAGVPAERVVLAQGGPDRPKACTALIALPALKAHWLTGIGTVLKNYIMFTGQPSAYHRADNAKLGEIWNAPHVKGKTRLVLVDALRPLCDKGPQPDPRYMWTYGGLIAGTDPVAVEAIGLSIITAKRTALRGEPWPLSPPPLCVQAADEVYGLGTSRMAEITLDARGWTQDLLVG
ncbi:MAG: DUF362 domain-containing protein [Thermoanaerobaculaceae bacterium]